MHIVVPQRTGLGSKLRMPRYGRKSSLLDLNWHTFRSEAIERSMT